MWNVIYITCSMIIAVQYEHINKGLFTRDVFNPLFSPSFLPMLNNNNRLGDVPILLVIQPFTIDTIMG